MIVPTCAQLSIVATKTANYVSKEQGEQDEQSRNGRLIAPKIDMFGREGHRTTVWDLGILLPQLCLPLEAEVWKIFSSSKVCRLCIAAT